MARTWVIGDIHGCALEFQELLECMAPAAEDRLISVGDLFHRGPDAPGVWRIMQTLPRFESIVGNHEHAMLRRVRRGTTWPLCLNGDGGALMNWEDKNSAAAMLKAVAEMPFFIEWESAQGPCWVTHAGIHPDKTPSESKQEELVRLHPLRHLPGAPFWFEVYEGPALVIFGHKPFRQPFVREASGRKVAIGVDTGCVYGGRLTAYCPEEDRFLHVPAKNRYLS